MSEKLDFVEKFLPQASNKAKKDLNELSLIVLKVKKIRVNKNQDQSNFAYNEDLRSTLFTNFYAPCAESEYASNKAELIFVKVLPAINAHVGSNNEFVEHLMCGDSNAPYCIWNDRVPGLSFKNYKNSNLVQAMFEHNKNLFNM
jgi:hypothetical protein